ncbi:MAG: BlaI/MecI/CopY family transcriptional regulator [Vampirovibrionales bacterium]|jgi:predicted transcriptional regulator|nr:BlaI/MecI/CopY family transcriptional regulator [Vampirovibrionales bacterium]
MPSLLQKTSVERRSMELKQGDLENIILNALWVLESSAESPVYVANIQDYINQDDRQWAYTTVKTVVDRLVDKGIARRLKDGKKFSYASQMNREEAGLNALKKMMRQYFRNDLDELQGAVNRLRTEGVGIQTATCADKADLERAFNKPSISVIL